MRLIVRNLEILEFVIKGGSYKEIEVSYGLNHQATSQVVKRTVTLLASVFKYRCHDNVPKSYHLIYKLREDKKLWLWVIKKYRIDILGFNQKQTKLL